MNLSQLPQRWGKKDPHRWILFWAVLSAASVITVLVLFLYGAIVIEEIETKSSVFTAGSLALLVTAAPLLCLVHRICTCRRSSHSDLRQHEVQLHQRPQVNTHNPVVIAVSGSDSQVTTVCGNGGSHTDLHYTSGDQDPHEVSNSPTRPDIDPPPSYESVMEQIDSRRENEVVSSLSSVEIGGTSSPCNTRTLVAFLRSAGNMSGVSSNTRASEVLFTTEDEARSPPPTYSNVVH